MKMFRLLFLTAIILSSYGSGESKTIKFLRNYNGGQCTANKQGAFRIAIQYCDGREWLTMQPAGEKRFQNAVLGKSCLDIKNKGFSRGNGDYMIDPDGGKDDNAFKVYCDMTSFGGGWTMCYTTDNHVNMKQEISSKFGYGFDGYRANCNNIPFTEVMFVDEHSKQKAAFTKRTGPAITLSGNYGKNSSTFGLWKAHGVASDTYKYQLLICDTSFYKGFHVSGHTGCFKQCGSWCGDTKSPYFRTAAVSNQYYRGVAFNENGHKPRSQRLISAGIR